MSEAWRRIQAEELSVYNGSRVYFITSGEHVKIGVSDNPGRRLKQMQTAQPAPLVLAGSMPGHFGLERELHRIFKKYRTHGEWFKLTAVISRFIAANCEADPRDTGQHNRVLPEWASAKTMASLLDLGASTFRAYVARGSLPKGKRFEGCRRWHVASTLAAFADRTFSEDAATSQISQPEADPIMASIAAFGARRKSQATP